MKRVIKIVSPEELESYPVTSVLLKTSEQEAPKHHCDAIVLIESGSDFRLLCRSACVAGFGHSFYRPHPDATDQYRAVEMWEEGPIARLEGIPQDFGYFYAGRYQLEKE